MMIMNGCDVMSPGDSTATLPTSSASPPDSGFSQIQTLNNGPPLCTGCGHVILDEFILRVQGRLWHSECLRCCMCQAALKQTCFARGSQVFCEQDFVRMFGTRCAGCGSGIAPTESVRRAHENIYHVSCFTCVSCEIPLDTGDEFYLRDDGRLICSHDYNNYKHTGDNDLTEPAERKSRTSLTDMQTRILTNFFRSCAKPSREMRAQLSSQTGLDQRVIQVWFQNKRAKCKKNKPDCNNNDACLESPEVQSDHMSPPGGYPLPIVNGDYTATHHVPQPASDFIQLPDFLTSSLTEGPINPWNATPEMWDANYVPPNVDLDPTDILDGEVCSTKRSEVSWTGHDQMLSCRQ